MGRRIADATVLLGSEVGLEVTCRAGLPGESRRTIAATLAESLASQLVGQQREQYALSADVADPREGIDEPEAIGRLVGIVLEPSGDGLGRGVGGPIAVVSVGPGVGQGDQRL